MQNKNLAYVSVEQKSNLFFKSFVQTCSDDDDDDETGINMDDMCDDDYVCVYVCWPVCLSVGAYIH